MPHTWNKNKVHDESRTLIRLPLACQHGDDEENCSRWLQLCFSLSLVQRSKSKPTKFLPHSQKQQHLIVTQNELKHIMNENLRKLLHRSLQRFFPSQQQSLHWLPRPETQELVCKARELSVNFVHFFFLNIIINIFLISIFQRWFCIVDFILKKNNGFSFIYWRLGLFCFLKVYDF